MSKSEAIQNQNQMTKTTLICFEFHIGITNFLTRTNAFTPLEYNNGIPRFRGISPIGDRSHETGLSLGRG